MNFCLRQVLTNIFQADLDKPETLAPVINGAYGVFSVTNFLEKLNAAPEIVQGKAVADVCKVCRWVASPKELRTDLLCLG